MSFKKPSYEEWTKWTKVVTDRLSEAIHVYNKPPYSDVYLLETEKQEKIAELTNIIRALHSLLEANESITVRPQDDVDYDDNRVIAELTPLLKQVADILPRTSDDMQYLLKSPWEENCTGRVASSFFCGPGRNLCEGVGSGRLEHGRLPEILSDLMEREEIGEERSSRNIQLDDSHAFKREVLARIRRSSAAGRF